MAFGIYIVFRSEIVGLIVWSQRRDFEKGGGFKKETVKLYETD